ncbi:MAG: hypothetical protein WBD20_02020 [Pirellulaceae bacterium]
MNTKIRRIKAFLLLFVASVVSLPVHAFADPSQSGSAIAELAVDLAKTLEGLGEDQILVGTFTGPAVMQRASAGAGIAKQLTDALARHDISTSKRAKFAIQGSYKRVVNGDGRVEIIIRGEFENNQTGQSFGGFEKVISAGGETNVEHLTSLFGVSADVPTNSPTKMREQVLLKSMVQPSVHVDNSKTRLRTSLSSPYAVEILTWHGNPPPGTNPATLPYQVKPFSLDEGNALVPIDRGDVYAIRLINESALDAAISISVDGLSLFSFADQNHDHIILGHGSSAVVYGWYRTSTHSDSFRVTSYADSAVNELGASADGVGMISVAFRQAWGVNDPIPDDEFAAKLLASRGENATGRGASVVQNYRPWTGHIGAIRNVISVRYERESIDP